MFIPIKANYGCEFSLTFLSNTIQFNSIRHHQYEHDEVDDDNTSRLSAPMRSSRSSRVTWTGVTCMINNIKYLLFRFLSPGPMAKLETLSLSLYLSLPLSFGRS